MNGWSRYQRGKSVGEENERKNEGESPAVGKENLEMDGASGKGVCLICIGPAPLRV